MFKLPTDRLNRMMRIRLPNKYSRSKYEPRKEEGSPAQRRKQEKKGAGK